MTFTDEELQKWWASKSKREKFDLLESILGVVDENDSYYSMVTDWKGRTDRGMSLSPKQLASIRKWER